MEHLHGPRAGPLLWPSRARGAKKSVQNPKMKQIFNTFQSVAQFRPIADPYQNDDDAQPGPQVTKR